MTVGLLGVENVLTVGLLGGGTCYDSGVTWWWKMC